MTGPRAWLWALLPAALLAQFPPPRIVIDGSFDDWAAVRRAPAPLAGGFRDIRVTDDARAVYFLLDFGRLWNLQESSDSTAVLLLNTDGAAATGRAERGLPGVDLIVELSPTGGRGVAAQVVAPQPARLSAYDLEFLSAPTYSAERFELRLGRSRERFPSPVLQAKVALLGTRGEVLAETGVLRHRLRPVRPARRPAAAADPLARAPGADFRVLSWNVSGDRPVSRPDPFLNVVGAVRPDVLLLDEVSPQLPVAALRELLERLPSPSGAPPWNVMLGTSGFRERGLLAARSPLAPAPSFQSIEYPARVRDAILARLTAPRPLLPQILAGGAPAAGGYLDLGGRSLLAVALDWVCCADPPGGLEDHIRGVQADAIRSAIRQALAVQPAEGVLVAGDFNLVGLREPLDALRQGLDPAGGDLALAEPRTLDGVSNTTWWDSNSPYPPGRLDFQLYSGSTLGVIRSFVFDSRVLPAAWLAAHHLQPADSALASDHRPLVTDFQWRAAGSR